MLTVSITRTSSSRATIAAGTRPPRVMATMALNGPDEASRQANARASLWNWSHETGKALSRGEFTGGSWGKKRALHTNRDGDGRAAAAPNQHFFERERLVEPQRVTASLDSAATIA